LIIPVPGPVLGVHVCICELTSLLLVALWKLDPDRLFKNGVVEHQFWGLSVLELENEVGWGFWV